METVRSRFRGRTTVQINRCPRCGDEHKDLIMVELDNYILAGATYYFNFWKLCPTTKTPIIGWFSDEKQEMIELA